MSDMLYLITETLPKIGFLITENLRVDTEASVKIIFLALVSEDTSEFMKG